MQFSDVWKVVLFVEVNRWPKLVSEGSQSIKMFLGREGDGACPQKVKRGRG